MEGNLWLYRLYFGVAILLWLPVSLSAVDLPNLTFRTITISDGLSNNIINTIYKDKRGFIWLGTQTGLDRFDGINVKSFSSVFRTYHFFHSRNRFCLFVGGYR